MATQRDSSPQAPARSWRDRLRAALGSQAYVGVHSLVGLVCLAVCIGLLDEVLESVLANGAVVRWDIRTVADTHAGATPLGTKAFYAVTMLGAPPLMAAIMTALAASLLVRRRRTIAITVFAAGLGDAALNLFLKHTVQRARPVFGTRFLNGESFSFPSGHTMGATVVYGMLAYLLVTYVVRRPAQRAMVVIAAWLLVALIAASRIYLGVHYPTDVAGGFLAGAAWLSVCITAAETVRRRAVARSR